MGLATILVGSSLVIGGVLLAIFAPGVLSSIWSAVSLVVNSIWSMMSMTLQALPISLKIVFGVLLASVILIPGLNLTVGVANTCTDDGVLVTRDPIVGLAQEAYESAAAINDLNGESGKDWIDVMKLNGLVLPKGVKKTSIFLDENNKTCYWLGKNCIQDIVVCKKVNIDETADSCYLLYKDVNSQKVFGGDPTGDSLWSRLSGTSKVEESACYSSCKEVPVKILGIETWWTKRECSVKDQAIDWLQYVITPTAVPQIVLVKLWVPYAFTSSGVYPISASLADKLEEACPMFPITTESSYGNWLPLSSTDRIWIYNSDYYDLYDFVADRIDTTFKPNDKMKVSSAYTSFIYNQVLIANPSTDLSAFTFARTDTKDGIIQKEIIKHAIGLSCDLKLEKNPDSGYDVGIQLFGIRNVFTWSTFVGAFVVFLLFNFVGYIAKHS